MWIFLTIIAIYISYKNSIKDIETRWNYPYDTQQERWSRTGRNPMTGELLKDKDE